MHLQSEGADQSKIEEYQSKVVENRNLSLNARRKLAAQYSEKAGFLFMGCATNARRFLPLQGGRSRGD